MKNIGIVLSNNFNVNWSRPEINLEAFKSNFDILIGDGNHREVKKEMGSYGT